MKKLDREIAKNTLKRSAWLFLTLLFIFSAFGVGVAAFIQATHQPNSSQTTPPPPPPPSADTSCALGSTNGAETLPTPDTFKESSKTTQLQTTDLQVGSGQTAKSGDCLVMKYYGTVGLSGREFDENFSKPTGLKFKLGAGEVIPGWDQGLVGMKVGGTRRLVIPAALAYGSQSPSEAIPANSDLVFVVKLESIQ